MELLPFCDMHSRLTGCDSPTGANVLGASRVRGQSGQHALAPDFARLCDYLGRPEVAV